MTVNSTEKVKLNPAATISSFYHCYPPGVARVALWKWFIVTSKGNFKDLNDKTQEEFAAFFDALQDLIKAVHLLQQFPQTQQKEGGETP